MKLIEIDPENCSIRYRNTVQLSPRSMIKDRLPNGDLIFSSRDPLKHAFYVGGALRRGLSYVTRGTDEMGFAKGARTEIALMKKLVAFSADSA